MTNKFIPGVDWLLEIGVVTDKNNPKNMSSGIRWFKRNIRTQNNFGNSLVCVKKGVYEADAAAIEKAYLAFKDQRKITAAKRKDIIGKVNAKKKADKESLKTQTFAEDKETSAPSGQKQTYQQIDEQETANPRQKQQQSVAETNAEQKNVSLEQNQGARANRKAKTTRRTSRTQSESSINLTTMNERDENTEA